MSTKISLIQFIVLALFVTACSPTVASDPAPVASADQESASFIPVTGENVFESSSSEEQSANDASNSSMDKKQIQTIECMLDGDLPRHLSGCVDWYSPDLNFEKDASGALCTPEDDLPHQRNGCDG